MWLLPASIEKVKPQHFEEAKALFQDANVKIKSEGKEQLDATIESEMYQKEYTNSKIDMWTQELSFLSKIAAYAPQETHNSLLDTNKG